ncbi:DUF4743 domain-containing protein [Pelistega sp. NLN82]|uniref:DUF4743 domain-containing protein n=1 Tax=Pelistega ratti TaxID=2652177 RepID=A0A6L9Y6G3_9BURK|nr:DUF4743 domain-containing protein [Pelistega ratti]NEN76009.1 DUF4743 domain-containing protein [Pelistega ratti]
MKKALDILKKELQSTINQAPITGSLPLYINQILTGTIHPLTIQATKGYDYFQHHSQFVNIQLPFDSLTEKSHFFNTLALYLREQNCLPFWRDEQVFVWQNNTVFAHIERTATRPLGLLTQAIHLNARTPDGRIYLSLRSPTKQTDPNKWDTLAGGLLNAQDTPEEGLAREAYEEAGIPKWVIQQCTPIHSIGYINRPLPEGYQYEEMLSSDCILPSNIKPQNTDGEVSQIETFTPQEVLILMQDGMVTTEAMIVLIDSIEKNNLI